jgi:hypothetical protein
VQSLQVVLLRRSKTADGFPFSWKSGRAADITAMTDFDPSATSARSFCCEARRRSGATVW